jgi:hypothetical protein
MSEAQRKEEPVAADIIGFVDAISGDIIYGWAFNRAKPAERLTVVIRSGGEEVGSTTADQEREDLTANKVGDGRHAFAFRLPPDRVGDLDAIELTASSPATGVTVQLAMAPPAAPAAQASLGDVHEALRRVLHSQRLLHRMLQGGLDGQQQQAPAVPLMDELRASQKTVADQVRGLEAAVVRLDAVAQALGASVERAQRRGPDGVTTALLLFVMLGVAGCLGLEVVRLLF